MKRIICSLIACLFAGVVNAVPIYTVGDGAAVSSIDRSASFDGLTEGDDLSAYSEDTLNIFVNNLHCCFNGGYYADGGYDAGNITDSLYRISGSDSALFSGMEIMLQDWGYGNFNTFVWQTYRAGGLTGSGSFITPSGGTIMGWSDVDGFDELRIGTFDGTQNALWFDNLEAQLATTLVPEPASLALLGLGLVGIGFSRKKKTA